MEPPVGAERVALSREHAGGCLALALEREHACGERVAAGDVLLAEVAHEVAGIVGARQRDAGEAGAGQGVPPQRGVQLLVADRHDELVGRVLLADRRPRLEKRGDLGSQLGLLGGEQHLDGGRVRSLGGEHGGGRAQVLHAPGDAGLLGRGGVVATHRLGDLRQVAATCRRDDRGQARRLHALEAGEDPGPGREALGHQQVEEVVVEVRDAIVGEARGRGAEDRHVLPRRSEGLPVAHELPCDIAAGVLRAAALELVDGDRVGEVQHVDLLELRRGTELRGHHVERGVDEGHDPGIALADAGGLDDDEVVRRLAQRDDVAEVLGDLRSGSPRRERPEHDGPQVDGVHADAVAQERAAALAPSGVDGDDGDAELALLVGAEAAEQLVGQGGLAGSAGAGDPEDGRRTVAGGGVDLRPASRTAPRLPRAG